MRFNKYKKLIQNENIDVPESLDIDKEYTGDKPKGIVSHPFLYKALIPAMSVLLVVLVVSLSLSGNKNTVLDKYYSSQVSAVNSESKLKEVLDYYDSESEKEGLFGSLFKGNTAINAVYNTSVTDVIYESEASETNIQVNGVDEADVIKADDKHIYRLLGTSLLVNEVTDGAISDTKKVELKSFSESLFYSSLMYVTDKYIVVIATEKDTAGMDSFYTYYNAPSYTDVLIVDKETLSIQKRYQGKGTYIDSRIVEGNTDVLYFIYSEEATKTDDVYNLPNETVDGVKRTVNYDSIYYSGDFNNCSYTHLVSFKLDDDLLVSSIVMTGPSSYDIIYATKESIFLAKCISKSTMEAYVSSKIDADDSSNIESIVEFDIADGAITPMASFITSGKLLDQFSMDYYNGYLRLALAETNHNKLEIYKLNEESKFELTGSITDGLGEKNETIKSSRFDGDTCLIVTAKNTDPLYKIDLTDPYNPSIIGSFKEDGFNTYLQYLSGDLSGLAFAIGSQTEDISDYYNIKNGSKIDLYDITGDNPEELDEVNFSNVYIDALDNHKSIFVYKNYIGFELNKEYVLFSVNKDGDTYKLNKVLDYSYNLSSLNEDVQYMYDSDTSILDSRMFCINGYFYLSYVSKSDATNINLGISECRIISFDSNLSKITEK